MGKQDGSGPQHQPGTGGAQGRARGAAGANLEAKKALLQQRHKRTLGQRFRTPSTGMQRANADAQLLGAY
jgi:hypothetical protein